MMRDTYYEEFEKNWKKFVVQLQGQMMRQAKSGLLIPASVNLILSDRIGFWDSRDSEGGRWLDRYEAEYPEKAKRIRDIFLNDMKFSAEEEKTAQYGLLKYVIPAGSAAVGFAVSGGLGAGTFVRAACTLVPAAVAYPVAVSVVGMKEEDEQTKRIHAYLGQLEKFKRSISSILLEDQ